MASPQAFSPEATAKCIGASVELTLSTNEKISGEIYAYDQPSCLVVVETAGDSADKKTWRLVNSGAIKTLTILAAAESAAQDVPAVNKKLLLEREQRMERQHREKLAQIGDGVSAEAQQTFDWLNKTMPCEWRGSSIVVMGALVINDPYGESDVKFVDGQAPNQQQLNRVRKVLAAEKAKAAAHGQ
eukprot:g449.t1